MANREFEKLSVDFDRDLLTAKELAYVLRCSYFTVSRWRSKGMPFAGGLITVSEARGWLLVKEANRRKHCQAEAK